MAQRNNTSPPRPGVRKRQGCELNPSFSGAGEESQGQRTGDPKAHHWASPCPAGSFSNPDCWLQPALASAPQGVDGESEFDPRICQSMCAVRGKVPFASRVFLLEKKGAESRVTLPVDMNPCGASWKRDSSREALGANCLTVAAAPGWRDTDAISMQLGPPGPAQHYFCPVELTPRPPPLPPL